MQLQNLTVNQFQSLEVARDITKLETEHNSF